MDHTTGYALFMDDGLFPKTLASTLQQLNIKKIETHKSNGQVHPINTPTHWVIVVDAENPVSSNDIKSHITLAENQSPALLILIGDPDIWPEQLTHFCHDFVRWPCSSEELSVRLSRLHHPAQPVATATEKTTALMKQVADLNLIGQSPAFIQTLDLIQKFAACDAPVFIDGETGTGKELAARAIHYMSDRQHKPFVAINCGALPDSLIESELFGSIKGAFTSACDTRKGLIGEAQGGTLFLDEIDTLSPKSQVTLLRFLQDQRFRPVGASSEQSADVRIVAATNQVASELSQQSNFRKDLFYRLYIMAITLPALNQRQGDIRLLVTHFIKRFNQRYQKEKILAANFITWLEQQHWEGNVRELENYLHRSYLMSDGGLITLSAGQASAHDTAPSHIHGNTQLSFNEAKHQLIEHFEKNYLIQLLRETHGNVSEAARRAAKERRALGKLIKKHHINVDDYRSNIDQHHALPGDI